MHKKIQKPQCITLESTKTSINTLKCTKTPLQALKNTKTPVITLKSTKTPCHTRHDRSAKSAALEVRLRAPAGAARLADLCAAAARAGLVAVLAGVRQGCGLQPGGHGCGLAALQAPQGYDALTAG